MRISLPSFRPFIFDIGLVETTVINLEIFLDKLVVKLLNEAIQNSCTGETL